jgi:3-deoxy-manno-octulosonate cytidylyltransferase (CMP-KDO synthetase)
LKTIGVIPARYESSRFPGKPLAKILGQEMIAHVYNGAKKSKILSDLIVATDDSRILDFCKSKNIKAVMTPKDCPTGTDRLWQTVQSTLADIVVNIQGDEPLVTGELIDELVEPLLDKPTLQMSTLAHTISIEELLSPNSVKVLVNRDSHAIYFSRFPLPYSKLDRSQMENPDFEISNQVLKHIGLYAYRYSFLKQYCAQAPVDMEIAEALEQLRALDMGAQIYVGRTTYRSWGVDSPNDIFKIEELLGAKRG